MDECRVSPIREKDRSLQRVIAASAEVICALEAVLSGREGRRQICEIGHWDRFIEATHDCR